MKNKDCRKLAGAISVKNYNRAIAIIEMALESGNEGPHWIRDLTKLLDVIKTGKPSFSIFAKGNGKLPFVAFSATPGEGFCVGAGDCLNFCYSFRAWRYPAAFCRQIQNSILLQSATGRDQILKALDQFKSDNPIDFRLYVDGDFTGTGDIEFWFDALINRPWLKAYGYSKSWKAILDYSGPFPANYQLNLSSGSIYGDDVKKAISKLPITRGEFIAVPIGKKVQSKDHGDRDHQKLLRKVYGKKAFTCPGLCGSCTNKGHACGSERFKGLDIIIAVH